MQGAMPRIFISTGQACSGGSGTSNELSNSILTLDCSQLYDRRLFGGFGDAAVRFRPARRIAQEFFDLIELDRIELAAGLGELQHVPPGTQVVQLDIEIAKDFLAFGVDVVKEDHENMLDHGASGTQRLAEVDLALAVGG